MARIKLEDFDLPISAFQVVRISSKQEVSGFFVPMRQNLPPSFVDGTGQSLILIPLEGERAFRRIHVQLGTAVEGLLFPDIQVAVRVSTRVNPHSEGQLGDISLAYGKVNILSADPRLDFGDAEPFPLQMDSPTSSETPIAFRQWSIVMNYGADEIELWRNDGVAPVRDDHEED